jgi:hypothetical protein
MVLAADAHPAPAPDARVSCRARPVRHRRPFARAAPDGKPEALIVNSPAPSRSSRRWCRSPVPQLAHVVRMRRAGALGSACWGAGTSASRSARRLPVRAASPTELGARTRGRAAAHGRPRQPRVRDPRRAPRRRPQIAVGGWTSCASRPWASHSSPRGELARCSSEETMARPTGRVFLSPGSERLMSCAGPARLERRAGADRRPDRLPRQCSVCGGARATPSLPDSSTSSTLRTGRLRRRDRRSRSC